MYFHFRGFLNKCNNSSYILNVMDETVNYDGAKCDRCCLLEEIGE